MKDEDFKKHKDSLKVVSNIKFKELIDRQRSKTNSAFVDKLEKSEYFKDLFFDGFIEGMSFSKTLKK